jgi:hypothetical protein
VQPYVDGPRTGVVTSDQVVWLVRDAPLQLSAGFELVDIDLTVIDDFKDDLGGGQVERNSYATLHGTGQFKLRRQLDWGSALVRPYIVLASYDTVPPARFNLGVYHTSTPARSLEETETTYDVDGYDILHRLNQSVGDAYSISAGDGILQKVEDIIQSQGFTQYVIDPSGAAKVATADRGWAFDKNVTWLNIVNDLLGMIGYQGVWSDWDGRLRCVPYLTPLQRGVEWVYDDNPKTTMLSTKRTLVEDYFDRPNRWVFYRTNMPNDAEPTEGNGRYTYINQTRGKTSVQERGGLVVSGDPIGFEAVSHADLVARAQPIIDADIHVPVTVEVETSPMPLHWHFDRLLYDDLAAGPISDVMCTSWALPLPPDDGDMRQSWKVLYQ